MAWSFREPDRVPPEISLCPPAKALPGANGIREFEQKEAETFRGVPGFDWGFPGLDTDDQIKLIAQVLQQMLEKPPQPKPRIGFHQSRNEKTDA